MKAIGVCLAIVIALALQTTLARFFIDRGTVVDLVLVVVVYVALTSGPVAGLLAGSVAGLVQDALSGGILGVGGFAKTVVGFVVGVVASQFILHRPLPRLIVFVIAAAVQLLCLMGLYGMLDQRLVLPSVRQLALQTLMNGIIGVVVLELIEVLPGAMQRRREHRSFVRARRMR